jgi:hypothetical protein
VFFLASEAFEECGGADGGLVDVEVGTAAGSLGDSDDAVADAPGDPTAVAVVAGDDALFADALEAVVVSEEAVEGFEVEVEDPDVGAFFSVAVAALFDEGVQVSLGEVGVGRLVGSGGTVGPEGGEAADK